MTGKPSVPDLKTYAAERPQHRTRVAFFETLPPDVQAEIIDAWKSGVRMTPIVEWLRAKGYDEVTKGKINTYMAAKFGTQG